MTAALRLTIDTGVGALLLWLALSGLLVAAGTIIHDGWRTKRLTRRSGLDALGRAVSRARR